MSPLFPLPPPSWQGEPRLPPLSVDPKPLSLSAPSPTQDPHLLTCSAARSVPTNITNRTGCGWPMMPGQCPRPTDTEASPGPPLPSCSTRLMWPHRRLVGQLVGEHFSESETGSGSESPPDSVSCVYPLCFFSGLRPRWEKITIRSVL